MREIKFRAFDSYIKKYLDIGTGDLCDIAIKSEEGRLCFIDAIKFEQFTGLTDKNGVDIYCGDIIHFESHKGYLLNSFIGEVIWLEEDAAFGYRTGGYDYPFNDADCIKQDLLSHMKIVGNIHENPELLCNN